MPLLTGIPPSLEGDDNLSVTPFARGDDKNRSTENKKSTMKRSQKDLTAEEVEQYIRKEFSDCFRESLGKEDRMKCDPLEPIMSIEDMEPHHKSWAWEVPAHYLKESRGLMDDLLKSGIITQVKCSVQWCTQGFFVEKPGAPGAPLRLRQVTDY